jgi:hypothetical protein
MRQRKFLLLIVVILAVLVPVGWAVWRLASRGDDSCPPAGLLSLADPGAFPAEYRSAARSVAEAVSGTGERPEEIFAEIEARHSDGMVIFHLWHRSAWEPVNRGVSGNPGGKCRDVRFDPSRGKVVETLFWQEAGPAVAA